MKMGFSDYTMSSNIHNFFKELPNKLRMLSPMTIYRVYESDIRCCLEVDVFFDEFLNIFNKFNVQLKSRHMMSSGYSQMLSMIHGLAVENKDGKVSDSVYFKTLREVYKVGTFTGIIVWQRTTKDTDIYKAIWGINKDFVSPDKDALQDKNVSFITKDVTSIGKGIFQTTITRDIDYPIDVKAVKDSVPNYYNWLMINLMHDKDSCTLFGSRQSYIDTYASIVRGYNQRQVLN